MIAQVADDRLADGSHAPRKPHRRDEHGGHEDGCRIDRDRDRRAAERHDQGTERRRDDRKRAPRELCQRIRLLEMPVTHGLLDQSEPDRSRERVGDPEHALEQRDVPDVRLPGKEEDRRDDLGRSLHQVGADQDRAPW